MYRIYLLTFLHWSTLSDEDKNCSNTNVGVSPVIHWRPDQSVLYANLKKPVDLSLISMVYLRYATGRHSGMRSYKLFTECGIQTWDQWGKSAKHYSIMGWGCLLVTILSRCKWFTWWYLQPDVGHHDGSGRWQRLETVYFYSDGREKYPGLIGIKILWWNRHFTQRDLLIEKFDGWLGSRSGFLIRGLIAANLKDFLNFEIGNK